MALGCVRTSAILAIHLLLFMSVSESLPVEQLNPSGQGVSQRNISSAVVFDQLHKQSNPSDWQHETLCLGEHCNKTVGKSMNGSHRLQEVRIRRAPGSTDIFIPPEMWTNCQVPKGLSTAEIRCKQWPSYMKCISYCVYGSTYDEGIERTNTCKYKENRWSKEFEECRPFVNCRLVITSPGSLKCLRNEVLNAPKCELGCQIYEDKDEVEKQLYSCDATGKWTPNLPFCAQPRGDINLARAPKEIVHKKLYYP